MKDEFVYFGKDVDFKQYKLNGYTTNDFILSEKSIKPEERLSIFEEHIDNLEKKVNRISKGNYNKVYLVPAVQFNFDGKTVVGDYYMYDKNRLALRTQYSKGVSFKFTDEELENRTK